MPDAVPACSMVPSTWPGLFGLGQHRVACHLVWVTWLLLGREHPSQGLEETLATSWFQPARIKAIPGLC